MQYDNGRFTALTFGDRLRLLAIPFFWFGGFVCAAPVPPEYYRLVMGSIACLLLVATTAFVVHLYRKARGSVKLVSGEVKTLERFATERNRSLYDYSGEDGALAAEAVLQARVDLAATRWPTNEKLEEVLWTNIDQLS